MSDATPPDAPTERSEKAEAIMDQLKALLGGSLPEPPKTDRPCPCERCKREEEGPLFTPS